MKKIISVLLCIAVLCSLATITVSALGGELANAKYYKIGNVVSGQITSTDDSDVYAFDLLESGKINVHYIGYMEYARLKIYDANGKEIWSETPYWNSTIQQISFKEDVHLTKGKYYFSISKYGNRYGSYNLKISYNTAYESFSENNGGSNNTISSANHISVNKMYIGQLALNDEVDTYRFVFEKSGKISFDFTGYMEYARLKIYDANGKEIWSETPYWNSTIQQISFKEDVHLATGTYYMSVSKYGDRPGNYKFTLKYTNAYETFAEIQGGNNNVLSSANNIELNKRYIGQIALNDEVDTYRISVPGGSFKLNMTAPLEHIRLKLYDESGNEIWSDVPYWNSTTKQISFEETITLNKGTYYFSVSRYNRYGNYSFTFSRNVVVYVDGKKIDFDQNPVIQNGRTLVPVRAIFEALGATVEWDDITQTVTSKRGNVTIKMTIGNKLMHKDNTMISLDVAPQIVNSRTLVPARAIAEAYGCNVKWDDSTWTVNITN